jgi:hypothetical protein
MGVVVVATRKEELERERIKLTNYAFHSKKKKEQKKRT